MNKRQLFFVCTLLSLTNAHAGIELEGPVAGWRNSQLNEHASDITVAYPKPPVDRGGQRNRSLIKGRIQAVGTQRKPHQFIVNGTPMPLYTDAQGAFVKPWAFGRGSNGVEIRSPDGKERKRVQFYEAHSGKTQAKLRIILGWNDAKAEVDMHVITPDGQHAFWAQPRLNDGSGLDVDSVDGGGPEIFSAATPQHGNYLIYVNYWGNFDAAGYNFDAERHERPIISTTVTIVSNENTLHEKREVYVVPLRNIGDLVLIKRMSI